MIKIRATTDFVRLYGYGHTYGDVDIEISNAPYIHQHNGVINDSYIIVSLNKHEDNDFNRLYKNQVGFFV